MSAAISNGKTEPMSDVQAKFHLTQISKQIDMFCKLLKLCIDDPKVVLEKLESKRAISNDGKSKQSFADELHQLKEEVLLEKFKPLIDFVKSDSFEAAHSLVMAEGHSASVQSAGTLEALSVEKFVVENSEENILVAQCRRLMASLSTMEVLIGLSPSLSEHCKATWLPALLLIKRLFWLQNGTSQKEHDKTPNELAFERVLSLLDLRLDEYDIEAVKIVKFRSNDDLFILYNGLPGYEESLNRILLKIGGHEWNISVLQVLEERADLINKVDQIRFLIDALREAGNIIDVRIANSLLKILKAGYNNLQFSAKKDCMNHFYQKYQLWGAESMDANYFTELNVIINNLAEHSTKGLLRQMAVRLSWHFMLSVKNCWWRLLNSVILMPQLSHCLTDILKHLPIVSNLTIPANDRDPSSSGERLILASLKRLLTQKVIGNDDAQMAWVNFCVSLSSGFPKKPVYEPAMLIDEFLIPLLPSFPWITLSCFERMLNVNTRAMRIYFRQPPPIVTIKEERKEPEVHVEEGNQASEVVSTESSEMPAVETESEKCEINKTEKNHVMEKIQTENVVEEIENEQKDEKKEIKDEKEVSEENPNEPAPVTDENPPTKPKADKKPAEPVRFVEPMKFFEQIFEIYMRAHKEGRVDSLLNENVRKMSHLALVRLVEYWHRMEVVEGAPLELNYDEIVAFQEKYSSIAWTRRFFARYLLKNFPGKKTVDQPDQREAEKFSNLFTIEIPGCVYDCLALDANKHYTRLECCEMDISKDKLPSSLCALCSLLDLALVSPNLSAALLTDAGNMDAFLKLNTNTLRKYRVYAARMRMSDLKLDEFKWGVQFFADFFDHMEKRNGKTNAEKVIKVEDGYRKGMLYIAPIVLCCDVATILMSEKTLVDSFAANVPPLSQTAIAAWLSNLPAVFGAGYLRVGSGHFGADRLASLTALRQLWMSCVALIHVCPVGEVDVQQRLEQLLVGTYDAFSRCQLRFDADAMLGDAMGLKLSDQTKAALERKMNADQRVPLI